MDEGFNIESEGSGEETELREEEEEDEEQTKQKASDQECEEEEQAKHNTESANTEEEEDGDEGEWSKMAKKILNMFNSLVLGNKYSYIHTQIGYTLCNWSDCYTFLGVTTWFNLREQMSFKETALNN